MSYPDSVQYLYSLGNELKAGAKFGLERMKTLLEGLGNPERGQQFIHIAGTNGKGSTAAMIASVLQESGLRTGLFTSPHLIEPTERIQIDGSPITPREFSDAFDIVHRTAEELAREGRLDAHPSYFETVTAMAFLAFRDRAQVSVIEVGLGGRLDATNVLWPKLCVITPVSYDHEAYLGNTLEAIAGEKAGILKPGVPVIVARQESASDAVITQHAAKIGCKVIRTADARITVTSLTSEGSTFTIDDFEYACALRGAHQIENATSTVMAGRCLGIPLPTIRKGLASVKWPGRLELISRSPDIFLDGAHNPAGARALASYIREFLKGRSVWLVYGAMRDKAIEEVTEQLFPLADRLIVTVPDYPRALRPEAILEVTNHPAAVIAENVPLAIEAARQAPADATVFCTGSLYLVGEVRRLLLEADDPVS